MREIDDEEGHRLVRIVRRGAGSVVTRRRAQMVLLPTQGMDVAAIAKYKGGHPPKFTLGRRREIKNKNKDLEPG